jgi:CRP/FNR family cyclic AMP-dependent transcriptional regulator
MDWSVGMIDLSLFRDAETKVFKTGQTIFSAGDPGDTMFVVAEGEVEIWVGPVLAEVVGRGGIFGEMALLDYEPRSADAISESECKLIAVNRERFEQLVAANAGFALQVMSIMAERLRKTNERLIKT